MMSHQNKTLLTSSYTHGKHLHTYTDTRTHTQNSKGSFQMTIHPKLSGYRNTFSKAAFHLRFFFFGLFAAWTPVTYFHLAAESLQDCQHFKRVKTFTLLQKSSNMKNLLLDFFGHNSRYIRQSVLSTESSPVSSNQRRWFSGVEVIVLEPL